MYTKSMPEMPEPRRVCRIPENYGGSAFSTESFPAESFPAENVPAESFRKELPCPAAVPEPPCAGDSSEKPAGIFARLGAGDTDGLLLIGLILLLSRERESSSTLLLLALLLLG